VASRVAFSKFAILGIWPGFRLPFLGNISKIRPSKTSPLTIFLGFCGAKRRKSGFGRQFFQNGSWKIPIRNTESVQLSLELI